MEKPKSEKINCSTHIFNIEKIDTRRVGTCEEKNSGDDSSGAGCFDGGLKKKSYQMDCLDRLTPADGK